MELTAKKDDLSRELALLTRIAERKTSIQICCSSVLLRADGDSIKLSATDLDTSLRSTCAAVVGVPGAIALPARKLSEIVKSLPTSDVRLRVLDDAWVKIESDRSTFKIAGIPAGDFPALPEFPAKAIIKLPSQVLIDLIAHTQFAICNEDARYYLAGALLLVEPKAVTMVTTDGHRLALARRACEVAGVDEPLRTLIPRKTIGELANLAKADGDVSFELAETNMLFAVGGRILSCKTIEGNFPAYETAFAQPSPLSVTVEREALSEAVRRVVLLSSERSRCVKVAFAKSSILLSASSPELGEATETINAECEGVALEIGFNAQYVLDVLAAIGTDRVSIGLKDAESQAQFKPLDGGEGEYRYVIMPMRL